jgi:hypothetical protein
MFSKIGEIVLPICEARMKNSVTLKASQEKKLDSFG